MEKACANNNGSSETKNVSLSFLKGVVEIRRFDVEEHVKIGYYKNYEKMMHDVGIYDEMDSTGGIYFVLNEINPSLYARSADEIKNLKNGAADKDVTRRRFILIDCDPIRPSGISSTDEEKKFALEKVLMIRDYLKEMYMFADPILADSGNGYHLLYHVDLENNDEVKETIRKFLVSLSKHFSDDHVKIDETVFNAARITKFYSTMVRKGSNLPERPHRRSGIVDQPPELEVTQRQCIENVVADLYVESTTTPSPTQPGPLDLDTWIERYGVRSKYTLTPKNASYATVMYEISPCPFGSHDKGTILGQMKNGALFLKCHHDSCGGIYVNHWKEFREMFEGVKNHVEKKIPDTIPEVKSDEDQIFDEFSDMRLGQRLSNRYSEVARYCSTEKRWYTWNGFLWIPDDNKLLSIFIKDFFKDQTNKIDEIIKKYEMKTDKESQDIKKALLQTRKSMGSRKKHDDVIAKARGLMDIQPKEFDTKDDMFNVRNGTIDLNDGKGYEPTSEDLMTQCGNVSYDLNAECPEWEKFIQYVIPEEDRREFLRRWCVYSLCGHAREEKILICVGGGGNGKSTFFNTIDYIMGDYFSRLDPDIFLEDSRDNQMYHIANLNHKRLVVASETRARSNIFSDSFLKKIAGEEELPARHPYGRPFKMKMRSTPVILTNSLPQLLQIDNAIRRRLLVMSWNVNIPDEDANELLGVILKREACGILNWILKGVEDYNKFGLIIPDSIHKETSGKLDEMNLSKNFMEDCIERTGNLHDIVSRSEVVLTYKKWCEENMIKPLGRNIFLSNLENNGIYFTRDRTLGYIVRGVRIITESQCKLALDSIRQSNLAQSIKVSQHSLVSTSV